MSELISKCCGTEVRSMWLWKPNENTEGTVHYCKKCHRLTEVKEKDPDEEWKNVRDKYSGVREEE